MAFRDCAGSWAGCKVGEQAKEDEDDLRKHCQRCTMLLSVSRQTDRQEDDWDYSQVEESACALSFSLCSLSIKCIRASHNPS